MLHQLPSTRTSLPQDGAERRFDLWEILNFCWREWKFMAAVFAAVLIIGTVYTLRQTPLYTATAEVLLDPRKEKAAGADAVLSDNHIDYAMIESEMAIIRSTVFLRRVVEKKHLVSDPEFGSGAPRAGAPRMNRVRTEAKMRVHSTRCGKVHRGSQGGGIRQRRSPRPLFGFVSPLHFCDI